MRKTWLRIGLALASSSIMIGMGFWMLGWSAPKQSAQANASLVEKKQLSGPVVSDAVHPVDTTGLAPVSAPLVAMEGEGGWPLENARPLPARERTANASEIQDMNVQRQASQLDMPAPLQNWEGIANTTGVFPPDTDGQVGPNHYVQIVNASGSGSQVRVWDKSGNQLYNFGFNGFYPSSGAGSRCRQYGYGDPVVVYDQMADRWLLTQFTNPPTGPYNECIAVSKTGTPTNNPADWWLYEFNVHNTKFNDYPKFGIWPDGYYMTANQFTSIWAGAGVWVFDRQAMLNGNPTTFIYFDLYDMDANLGGLLPSNLMGSSLPPAGAPNYLMSVDMDWNGSDDVLHIFEVHTRWNDPSSSTLTWLKDLVVAPFDWNFTNPGRDVPQPGTTQGLDGLGDRLMMHLWYRNFGTHEALVVNHTVDVGSDLHGIRWYEIRDNVVNATLLESSIHQQGTYAPDTHHRWMGSIAMDRMGNIALGYSVASNTLYPSIRYTGRLAGDSLGLMTQTEETIITGGGHQSGKDNSNRGRWGDYSAMSVDPVDDCTFWYTQEYIQTNTPSYWQTRVASFKFPNCTANPTGTLSGSVSVAGSGAPLQGATIQANSGVTLTASTLSQANGSYSLTLPEAVYSVSVSAFGYNPQTVSGVGVYSGTLTTQDFSLSPAPLVVVEGVVSDVLTGWALYASVIVQGLPIDAVWSDPHTGYYSLTLPAGSTYILQAEAFSPGYLAATEVLTPVLGSNTQDFDLQMDAEDCQAPGYQSAGMRENFEGAFPPTGWLVVDNQSSGVEWMTCSDWGDANWTGGGGECAGVNSDAFGEAEFDTELWSPVFDAAELATTMLQFKANYQNFSTYDFLDVDISADGGGTWQNLLRWNEDHGGYRSLPGEQVSLDMAGYLSGSNHRLRWRYYDPNTNDWDWYVQIDEVNIGAGACSPLAGGLVVGHVNDANLGHALNGALVSNASGYQAISTATPDDPQVEDGFFISFSPSGTQPFSVTMTGGYAAAAETVDVVSGTVVSRSFELDAGWVVVSPSMIQATVEFANQMTLPLTLTNQGDVLVSFELVEQNLGTQPQGPIVMREVVVPEAVYTLNNRSIQRYRHRPPFLRPEIRFELPQAEPMEAYIDVLLLNPDEAVGGDISLIKTALGAFSDLQVETWAAGSGNPSAAQLAAYDVVIVGNDYKWSSAGMDAMVVGNALADYLDAGGAVIETLFVQDWAGWELGGRYISASYSPFTPSSADNSNIPYTLGTVYDPDHPVMKGVHSVTDNPLIGISHQNVGLSSGALRLADWSDGQMYVAVKQHVVGVNQLWYHGSNWSGDVATLMHNAIVYLVLQDAGWLTESPFSGTLATLDGKQVILVTMNSADASTGRKGVFLANLIVNNNTPYGPLVIPVVMTVTVPYETYLPYQ